MPHQASKEHSMVTNVDVKMDRNNYSEQSIWGDSYMKITYAMLAIAVLPAIVGSILFL